MNKKKISLGKNGREKGVLTRLHFIVKPIKPQKPNKGLII